MSSKQTRDPRLPDAPAPFASRQLARLFRAVARAAVASTCTVSCGSEAPDVPQEFEPVLEPGMCVRGPALDAPKLTRSVDFLGIYRGQPLVQQGAATLLAWTGAPCGSQTLEAECQSRLEAASRVVDCTEECARVAVVGHDGKFERIVDRTQLLALLGPIDTPSDAAFLAAFENFKVACPDQPLSSELGTLARPTSHGFELQTDWEDCGVAVYHETFTVRRDGTVDAHDRVKTGPSNCAIGRRPVGLCSAPRPQSQTALGAYLVEAAQLEAASVHAFRQLARELALLAAPYALIAAADAARADEVRHARAVSKLARAHGAKLAPPQVRWTPARSAYELALENAREGCVRETFGALLATHQAEAAVDPDFRRVMREIARDETRHAALAWQLDGWLATRLSERERAQVRAAREQAAAALRDDLTIDLSHADCARIGYPSAELSARLLDGLRGALLS